MASHSPSQCRATPNRQTIVVSQGARTTTADRSLTHAEHRPEH